MNKKDEYITFDKGKIWYYVRSSFWAMIAMWVISALMPEEFNSTGFGIFFGIVWVATSIFCFVNSIRHLTKYTEKAFAITALVISSILMLLFAIGFMYGILIGLISI